MRRVALTFTFISLCLIFNSCDKVKGKGDVVSQLRNITGFTAISLAMEGDLYFTPDSVYSVEIQAQQNILDVIESTVEGGRLVFKIEDHTVLGTHEPIRIYIHAPSVNDLDISGSGNIMADSLMDETDLHYNVSGSGNINLYEIKGHSVSGNISGSGNIKGLSGTADQESLNISGSGNLDFLNVMADSVYVTISGSGDVKVYAVKYLEVTISGSGNVKYNGSPVINQHISGSGNVTHI
jgi:hypothetical protein